MWVQNGKLKRKKKKQDSNTFKGIVWDVVVFHRVTFIVLAHAPASTHTPTRSLTVSPKLLLKLHLSASAQLPLWTAWPHLPLVRNMILSLPVISCSEVNDWSPTFHVLLPFPFISYMVTERIVKSIIWAQHLQGEAGLAWIMALRVTRGSVCVFIRALWIFNRQASRSATTFF